MNPRRRSRSFTLVEMLVGIAVFSLLVLLLYSIMSNATGIWQQQRSKGESFQEARAALRYLSRDFNVAMVTNNFYANTNQVAFLTTLPDSAQATNYNNGDICAVGYSLEWGTNDASAKQSNMSLYRYVCFSNPTYAANIVQGINVKSIFTNPDNVNTVRELLARNVLQFTVTPYTVDSTGNPTVVPTPTTVFPNMINFNISTLNDRTAALLTTQAQWQTPNIPLIQQNLESFSLRVRTQGP
jgi:prepilin-type N-terminal cleavage/methylation domain-containing protein